MLSCKQSKKKSGQKIWTGGCHGQTIYHQGTGRALFGKKYRVHVQMGEALWCGQTWSAVVSDFSTSGHGRGRQGAR